MKLNTKLMVTLTGTCLRGDRYQDLLKVFTCTEKIRYLEEKECNSMLIASSSQGAGGEDPTLINFLLMNIKSN